MILNPEQIRTAYKKLPEEIQNLIMDNETTDLIETSLKAVGLNEEQYNLADSEILYAMYALQTLDQAIENVAKLSNKQTSEFSDLKRKLEEKIFNKYKDLNIKVETRTETKQETPDKPVQVSKVPEVAPEIHPMVEPGETVHEVPHVETAPVTPTPNQVPANPTPPPPPAPQPAPIQPRPAPTPIPQPAEIKVKPISDTDINLPKVDTSKVEIYPSGTDPYREPLA